MSVRTWEVERTVRHYTPKGTTQEFQLIVIDTRGGFAWSVVTKLGPLPMTHAEGKAAKLWQAKLYARRAAEKRAKTLPW